MHRTAPAPPATRTAPRTRRAGALAVVLLLAVAQLLLVAPNAAAAAGDVKFTDLARDPLTTGDDIFGTGATVGIQVKDDDLSGVGSTTVRVHSAFDSQGEMITLRKTMNSPPTFFGTVGFEFDTIQAENGLVGVTDNSEVTVVYTDSSEDTTRTHQIRWQERHTGAVSLDEPSYRTTTSQATVTVTDDDENKNTASAEMLTVEIESDSQRVLQQQDRIDLTETGVNTGRFTGTFTFETTNSDNPSDNLVFVRPGDRFRVTYEDEHDASGKEADITTSAVWRDAHTALLHFMDADQDRVLDSGDLFHGTGSQRGCLRVLDLDRAGQTGLAATVRTTAGGADPTGVSVPLAEVGPGEFIGCFGFARTGTSSGTTLRVDEGNTVNAAYADPADGQGVQSTVVMGAGDRVVWTRTHDGSISWKAPDLVTNKETYHGTGTKGIVRVEDDDLNANAGAVETGIILVTSSRDPVGVRVTVQETGANTGIFVGHLLFKDVGAAHESRQETSQGGCQSGTLSDCAVIWVEHGDTATATYVDDFAADAEEEVERKDSVTWRFSSDGAIFLDTRDLDGGGGPDFYGVTSGTGNSRENLLRVRVVDMDANGNGGSKDTLDLTVTSDLDSTGIDVTATETHANSGVFDAQFGFRTGASQNDPNQKKIQVADGSTVTVTYDERRDASGSEPAPAAKPAASLTWHAPSGTSDDGFLLSTLKAHGNGAKVEVRVARNDATNETDTPHEVVVCSGGSDVEADNITLEETADGSNVFIGEFTIDTGASETDDDGKVQVDGGASRTIVLTVDTDGDRDCTTGSPAAPTNAPNTVEWFPEEDGIVTLDLLDDPPGFDPDSRAFGTQDAVGLEVQDRDGDDDTDLPDIVEINSGGETFYALEVVDGFGSLDYLGDPGPPAVPPMWGVDPAEMSTSNDKFHAFLHFEDDATSSNGRVAPSDGSTVTVTYPDAQGTSTTDSIRWDEMGAIAFKTDDTFSDDATGYFGTDSSESKLFLEVAEDFYNDDPDAAESFTVRVGVQTRAADNSVMWHAAGTGLTGGEAVSLTETGADTGVFRGELILDDGTNGLDVFTTVPERVTVQYFHDGSVTDGVVQARIDFTATGDASVAFVDSPDPYTGALREGFRNDNGASVSNFNGEQDIAYVRVIDTDEEADSSPGIDTVKVRIRSDTDLDGIEITLSEYFGRHGQWEHDGEPLSTSPAAFGGVVRFSKTASDASTNTILVQHGDEVRASYVDARGAEGEQSTFTDAVTWTDTRTGNVSLDAPQYVDTDDTATITVFDDDLNTNAATSQTAVDAVVIRSINASGVLRDEISGGSETSDDLNEQAQNSARFESTIEFDDAPAGVSGDDKLQVQDGDTIQVDYTDAAAGAGETGEVRRAEAQWFQKSAIRFDMDFYPEGEDSPKVTLEDTSLSVTSGQDSVQVQVFGQSDGVGETILLTETGPDSGLFEGSFSFENSYNPDNNELFAQEGDQITAYHFDENLNGGTARLATAIRGEAPLEENTPPTATLSASPSSGDVPLEVTFTPRGTDSDGDIAGWTLDFGDGSAAVERTSDTSGASETHTYEDVGTFNATLTVTDDLGATATATVEITVASNDTVAPNAIADLAVTDELADSVVLEWTAVADGSDQPDDPVQSYLVRHSTSPIEDESDWDAATEPSGSDLSFSPTSPADPGSTQEVTVLGLASDTDYHFAVRGRDEAGNLGPIATVEGTTEAEDTTAPTGSMDPQVEVDGTSATFTWTALVEPDSSVRYFYVVDDQATTTVTESNGQRVPGTGTSVTLPDQEPGSHTFHLVGISAGGSSDTEHVSFTIEETGGDGLPSRERIAAANRDVQETVEVSRENGDNVVTWDLSGVSPDPDGVQIWRATSPFSLRATFERGTPEFDTQRFTDAGAPASARYVVTVFYTDGDETAGHSTVDLDELPGYDTGGIDFDELGASAATGGDGGLAWYWWALIILGSLVVVVAVVVAVILLRKPEEEEEELVQEEGYAWDDEEGWPDDEAFADDEEEAPEDDEAEAPEEEEEPAEAAPGPDANQHHITCPECQKPFLARGTKPLVAKCPHCGVKGILRE